MELRYLESFEAVVRCGGFTKAAADLHLAQPAISAHIKRLEHELGVTLLHRSRTVTLTAAGEQFLPHVRLALANLEEGRRLVRAHRDITTGHVHIAITPLTSDFDISAVLSAFRKRYPGITVSLRTGLIAELLDALHRNQVDIVIGPIAAEHEGYRRVEIASEKLLLITPLGGARRVTTLLDVADQPFVCLTPDSGLRHLLDTAFESTGKQPRVEYETHSPANIRELVAAGLGCALIAQSVANGRGPEVLKHEIDGLPEHPPLAAVAAQDAESPVARFLEEIAALAIP